MAKSKKKVAPPKPAPKRATRAPAKATRAAAKDEPPKRLKAVDKGALPTKEHRRICVTDANRVHDHLEDLHESAFDGPKVLFNGQWHAHVDELPDGTWRYAPM